MDKFAFIDGVNYLCAFLSNSENAADSEALAAGLVASGTIWIRSNWNFKFNSGPDPESSTWGQETKTQERGRAPY